jgi:hypothetical protein
MRNFRNVICNFAKTGPKRTKIVRLCRFALCIFALLLLTSSCTVQAEPIMASEYTYSYTFDGWPVVYYGGLPYYHVYHNYRMTWVLVPDAYRRHIVHLDRTRRDYGRPMHPRHHQAPPRYPQNRPQGHFRPHQDHQTHRPDNHKGGHHGGRR